MSEFKGPGIRKPKTSLASDDDENSAIDSAPLSLAEELAEEAARGIEESRRHRRALRADQARRHPHRRTAADDACRN